MSFDSTMEAARNDLGAGRVGVAIGALRDLTQSNPQSSSAWCMLGEALIQSRDHAGAEQALRRSLELDPKAPGAALQLASLLSGKGRSHEAVSLLEPFAEAGATDVRLLTLLGATLNAVGRREDSVKAYERAAEAAPNIAAAQHNLAGALAEAYRYDEAEAALKRAFDMGLDAPESWLVLGRAHLGRLDIAAAEGAVRQAIRRRPDYADAHAELAQLIWMETEDLAAARSELDLALQRSPGNIDLCLARARLLEYACDAAMAYDSLGDALSTQSGAGRLQIAAALLAIETDPEMAFNHARSAVAVLGEEGPAAAALCQANLALGRADEAARIAEELSRQWPLDQYPVTLCATAWRIMGDPRYRALYDYERLVVAEMIETPAGWPNVAAFLDDLSASLRALQRFKAHPVGQSLRFGTQTAQSLAHSKDPIVAAFFRALDPIIRNYIEAIRRCSDVLGRRVTDGYRFSGAWSVLLRPGGHHVNHIHPMGWISSAFHIDLPKAVSEGHQGWLKFGEPGMPTSPRLGPEHFVRPQAGALVLFPSYMWHGTVRFGGAEPRLTAAFDVLPA